ncbi:MAG: methylmalonyl Co-A mutase-associated GTPase MeaB [Chitinophagaceae bacterium]|nr:methylmalonyl Co-A mutase-associated GTPase MeaB [Chitinophagaceae bacterium]
MHALVDQILKGSQLSLARAISLVENKSKGYLEILSDLPAGSSRVIGITGPPGAGKSTITDGLIGEMIQRNCTVGVICVDPTSPFNYGALLGDRIRMNKWFNNPSVFIRSVATRGSFGGLSISILEVTDVMKAFGFDYIIIETVGVGQSEVEIAGLADVTVVVLVPEAGDEIQTMKAGLMEIADIFVVNKSDRPGSESFVVQLKKIQPAEEQATIPVLKTIATQNTGIDILFSAICDVSEKKNTGEKHIWLLVEKAWLLLQHKRMDDINKPDLFKRIEKEMMQKNFNIYKLVESLENKV